MWLLVGEGRPGLSSALLREGEVLLPPSPASPECPCPVTIHAFAHAILCSFIQPRSLASLCVLGPEVWQIPWEGDTSDTLPFQFRGQQAYCISARENQGLGELMSSYSLSRAATLYDSNYICGSPAWLGTALSRGAFKTYRALSPTPLAPRFRSKMRPRNLLKLPGGSEGMADAVRVSHGGGEAGCWS